MDGWIGRAGKMKRNSNKRVMQHPPYLRASEPLATLPRNASIPGMPVDCRLQPSSRQQHWLQIRTVRIHINPTLGSKVCREDLLAALGLGSQDVTKRGLWQG